MFKALADLTWRRLPDRLFERDGRALGELKSEVAMTRFGVMKHLRVLEEAELVVSRRSGREKLRLVVTWRSLYDPVARIEPLPRLADRSAGGGAAGSPAIAARRRATRRRHLIWW